MILNSKGPKKNHSSSIRFESRLNDVRKLFLISERIGDEEDPEEMKEQRLDLQKQRDVVLEQLRAHASSSPSENHHLKGISLVPSILVAHLLFSLTQCEGNPIERLYL